MKGKKVFIAGIGDDQGYGWAIAKALAEVGAEILIGTWTPIYKIFTQSWASGKFDASRVLSSGLKMNYLKVYPLDVAFDEPNDIPQHIKENKRYKDVTGYTISEVASQVQAEFGTIDMLVHSIANGPEIHHPLVSTSRKGYLEALSFSAYSFVSLVRYFAPFMKGGSALSLTYMASERAVPGYGGGMSSAKAALESDNKVLAWEVGQKWGIRVNTISAGALESRAAKAIGFIDRMMKYEKSNAPLNRNMKGEDVGHAAVFLLSDKAAAITGTTVYVDNGMHAMGIAMDSASLHVN